MCLCSDGLQRRTPIETRAKSDGLRLLRAIDSTQARGQEGARVDPTRAAHEAELDVGDVGSDRYHRALEYLLEEGALAGDEHTATQTYGLEGTKVDPARAPLDAALDVGDVGSDRYHRALGYLLEEGALVGDDHTAFDVG